MHVKFISVLTHSWKMLFFPSCLVHNMQDKNNKRSLWLCLTTSQKESLKRQLCWVYPFLNVALPFTVASSCVGERRVRLHKCVSLRVDVCPRVCAFVWVRGCFLWVSGCSWAWFCIAFVCLHGPRTDVGVRHFKKLNVKDLYLSSVADVCVVCWRSSRVMNKWSGTDERTARERQRNVVRKRFDIIFLGKKKKKDFSTTTSSCSRVYVLQIGALDWEI